MKRILIFPADALSIPATVAVERALYEQPGLFGLPEMTDNNVIYSFSDKEEADHPHYITFDEVEEHGFFFVDDERDVADMRPDVCVEVRAVRDGLIQDGALIVTVTEGFSVRSYIHHKDGEFDTIVLTTRK